MKSRNLGRRFLALVLTLVMCVSLLSNTALAAATEGAGMDEETVTPEEKLQQEKQILDTWLKANDNATLGSEITDGAWNQTTGGKVKVSKTIAPTGTENKFVVTLEVQTTENLQEKIYAPDAAVTLVIDVSASMSQCAICGANSHAAHEFVDNGPKEDDAQSAMGYPVAFANDNLCDYAIEDWGSGFYVYCGLSKDSHTNHEFEARIDAAKSSALSFINNLRKNTPTDEEGNYLAHRWVSLVSFSGWANIECDWADITTTDGYNEVVDAISQLKPNIDEDRNPTKPNEGGTNICDGLQKAAECMDKRISEDAIDIQSIDNRYTVLLSDGMPSFYLDGSGNRVGFGNEADTKRDLDYFNQTVSYANNLKKSSALYSICFCAARDICYTGDVYSIGDDVTVLNLLDQMSDVCYPADNADQLQTVFDTISELLKFLTEAWIVTDPMGDLIIMNYVEENDIGGIQNVGDEPNMLSWDLQRDTPIKTTSDGDKTTYTYQLKYNITLDNLNSSFEAQKSYATNDYTDLTYVFRNQDNHLVDEKGNVLEGEDLAPYSIGFNVPQVKGYVGEFTFTKTNPEGKPLSGAKFELSINEAGKSWTRTAESDSAGYVRFEKIPSGHVYTLTETTAPSGYEAVKPMTVTVSYGEVTVEGKEVEYDEDTGYTITDPHILGNLTVSKTVTGDGGDKIKNWNFTVTLDDTTVNGIYGEGESAMTFANGVANFTLKDGTSKTATGLPAGIKYTVTEAEANTNGYTTSTTNATGTIPEKKTVTAKFVNDKPDPEPGPDTTQLTVNKVWANNDGTAAAPEGASITVTLYQNGEATNQTITLNAENSWTDTFVNLEAKDAKGDEYNYTVVETAYEGYTAAYSEVVDGEVTITNTQEPSPDPEPETTQLTVNKVWVNSDGTSAAPDGASITVTLYQNGEETDKTVTLSAENGWTDTFTNLAAKDAEGNEYNYTAVETAFEGYTATYSEVVDSKVTITNTQEPSTDPEPETTQLTVSKMWVNNDGTTAAPEGASITVTLYQNGEATDQTITLNVENNWTYTFVNLPVKDAEGNDYAYTVQETAYEGYTAAYSDVVDGEVTITNTQEPSPDPDPEPETTQLTVNKVWVNNDGTTAAPEGASVTVTLYLNGEATDQTVTLSAENNWTDTFADLDVKDAEGNECTYTAVETAYEGYTATYSEVVDGVVTITNTQEPSTDPEPETTQLTVTKTWANSDGTTATAPDGAEVTVTLHQNGVATEQTATLNEENGWTAVFTDLEVKDAEGNDYTYTVQETAYEGYTATYTVNEDGSITITNTLEPVTPPPSVDIPETEYGSLTISKAVVGGGDEASDKTYTFNVTGPDGYSSSVSITGEGSIVLANLVPGTYSVTEQDASLEGWTWNVEVSGDAVVAANANAEITVTNRYEQEEVEIPEEDTPLEDTPDDDTPETDIPDDDTPLEDIPDNDTPLVDSPEEDTPDIPDEDTPVEEVPDEDIPLSDAPEEDEPYEDIPEVDVPLDKVPTTGDSFTGIHWMVMLATSASGMALVFPRKKNEEDEA